jgi:L-asparagine oxygenase
MDVSTIHPSIPLFDFEDLHPAVAALQAGLSGGAALLRGAEIGVLPPTPTSRAAGARASKTDKTSEATLLRVAHALGEPVGYVQEHGGEVVQDLYPLRESLGRQVSTSSGVVLAFHTETAFHPHRPRYLVLLCLKGDPSAATTLCSLDAVLSLLDPRAVQVLSEPRFRTGVDESFGSTSWLTPAAPVIRRSAKSDAAEFVYDGDLTIGIDAVAQDALEALGRAIQIAQTSVVLEAGDVLIVDNHRAVHGRSPFTARFDGTDRWLQRTFVVSELESSASDRVGRVITTRFDD